MPAVELLALQNTKRADTFDGAIFNITVNGIALNLTGATAARFMVRSTPDRTTTPVLSKSLGSGITITDAPNGQITLDKIPGEDMDFEAGGYFWDLEITLSSGDVKTYPQGIWQIVDEYAFTTEVA